MKKVQLPSIPAFIVATGLYDVDYRIVVACRSSLGKVRVRVRVHGRQGLGRELGWELHTHYTA